MTAAGTLTPPASAAAPATGEGLRVRGLRVAMGPLPIVHGVDLAVAPGEILGLVGESGSGKSVSLRAIPGLLPPKARIAGEVLWNGRNLLAPGRSSRPPAPAPCSRCGGGRSR